MFLYISPTHSPRVEGSIEKYNHRRFHKLVCVLSPVRGSRGQRAGPDQVKMSGHYISPSKMAIFT